MADEEKVNWRDGRSLAGRLQHMMEKQHRWDVSLRTEEDDQPVIKAHQLILVAGSPYFEDMFDEKTVTKEEAICLKDIKYSVLKQVIRFLYYEDIQLTNGCVIDVMKAAMKFKIPQLISKCFKFIVQTMSVENVCDFLSFSVEYSRSDIRDKCIDFISKNANNLFKSTNFLRLSQAALVLVLKNDCLEDVSEMDVYKACMKWADHTCQTKEIEKNNQNRREVLGEAVFEIRFTTFTVDEFTEITDESQFLTFEEQSMFYRNIAGRKELPQTTEFNRFPRRISNEESRTQSLPVHDTASPKTACQITTGPKVHPQTIEVGRLARRISNEESLHVACSMIDTLKVEVLEGDISKEETDAIVNSSDKDLTFRGDESKALLEADRESLTTECQKIKKPVDDLVVVTNARKLKVKHIIHVVASSKKENWPQPIKACFQKAESMGLTAISIPALGTGVMKIPSKDMAPVILNAIKNFVQKDKPKALKHVRIIVFKKEMVGDFINALQSLKAT